MYAEESLDLLDSVFFNNRASSVCDAALIDGETQSISLSLRPDFVICFAVTCTRAGQSVKDGQFEISVLIDDEERGFVFASDTLRAPEIFKAERLLSGRGASSTLHNLVAGANATTPALFLGAMQSSGDFRLAGIRCVSGSPPSVALEIQSLLKCGLGNLRNPDNSPERNLVRKSGLVQSERDRGNPTVEIEIRRKDKRIADLEDQVRTLKQSLAVVSQEKNTLLNDFGTLLKKAIDEKLEIEKFVEPRLER